jgi:hypothetical protein
MKTSESRTNERTGVVFTAVGFGGAPIGSFNGTFTEAAALDMVAQSWDRGIATSTLLRDAATASVSTASETHCATTIISRLWCQRRLDAS